MVKDKEFEKYLLEISDPKNNSGINYNLPKNPTPPQVTKYKLCKQILNYKLKNNLTWEQVTERMGVSKAETEDILFCHIEEFTYSSKLLEPAEINNA